MPDTPDTWVLHPDRVLPADTATRAVARRILDETAPLPIVSMHGHVEAQLLADDAPFADPAALLVTPDHYLVRMLVSQATSPGAVRDAGVRSVADLGVSIDADATPHDRDAAAPAPGVETDPRTIWRRFCAGWPALRGTPTRLWLEHVLSEVFAAPAAPSPGGADALYDHVADRLAQPEFRPRALLRRFGIEVLATTDAATDSLTAHARLAADGYGPGAAHTQVIPTFRPDVLLEPGRQGWTDHLTQLSESSGIDAFDYDRFDAAMRARRDAFVRAGARASDHGHLRPTIAPLPIDEARALFARALRAPLAHEAAAALTADLLFRQAAMAADDGLVMQLHTGVLRDHDRGAARQHGTNIGYDIPVQTEFTLALRPVLETFGHHPNFRLIVFTVDETAYSRELAPLAGAYPAMRLGAPWWFLDAPEAMRRFRAATIETAGLRNTSGFVDDTRAFCSIPARHDLARRVDAGYLAGLVVEHRLDLDEALEAAVELAYGLAKDSYPDPRTTAAAAPEPAAAPARRPAQPPSASALETTA